MDYDHFFQILDDISVMCRDDGHDFTVTTRLDAIEKLLTGSDYFLCSSGSLYRLYGKKDLRPCSRIVLVSSHVDCDEDISKCFSSVVDDDLWKGTFDNQLTNAVAVQLMLDGDLPDNVYFAFTGDEECHSKGAKNVSKLLEKNDVKAKVVVLDVTNVGFADYRDFTVENARLKKKALRDVLKALDDSSGNWLWVPLDDKSIPDEIDSDRVHEDCAWEDESERYMNRFKNVLSVCIPVDGEMHCDTGVYAHHRSIGVYHEFLGMLLNNLSKSQHEKSMRF